MKCVYRIPFGKHQHIGNGQCLMNNVCPFYATHPGKSISICLTSGSLLSHPIPHSYNLNRYRAAISRIPDNIIHAAIQNLSAKYNASDSSISISWNTATNSSGDIVYRKEGEGQFISL